MTAEEKLIAHIKQKQDLTADDYELLSLLMKGVTISQLKEYKADLYARVVISL